MDEAQETQDEESKGWISGKSIIHFLIAMVIMVGYFYLINFSLMKVQGLEFHYLWVSGEGGGGGH